MPDTGDSQARIAALPSIPKRMELTARARILVVDDNAQNRALAAATLEDEGYDVIIAADGAEALATFDRNSPDCVLLDVRMPGSDGPSVCEQIRARPQGGDVPVVFLTAQRDVDTFDRALRAGGDDFLTKPVQPAELLLRVQAALKLRDMRAELREHYELVRRQRDALMRLSLQRERLSQFIVHDLKNPIGTLDLSAQQLMRSPELSEKSRTQVQRIRGEARQLLRMLENLLDVSRSDQGALEPHRTEIEFAALIDEVLTELALKAGVAGVTLAHHGPPVLISADRELLRRVLENLADNAIRHAPEHSEVALTTAPSSAGVELRVADRGAGIAPDARAKIFEPFAQLERDTGTIERASRGLGLTFCKVAVEAHGGRIWIEDGAPGAVFCVSLPHGA